MQIISVYTKIHKNTAMSVIMCTVHTKVNDGGGNPVRNLCGGDKTNGSRCSKSHWNNTTQYVTFSSIPITTELFRQSTEIHPNMIRHRIWQCNRLWTHSGTTVYWTFLDSFILEQKIADQLSHSIVKHDIQRLRVVHTFHERRYRDSYERIEFSEEDAEQVHSVSVRNSVFLCRSS